MKPESVKFISNDQQRQFAYNVRKNVNAYFTENKISPKGNTTLVVKTIIMLSLYIVPFIFILFISMSTLAALFLSVLMGIAVAGIGMGIMHDAVHGSYSKKRWVNKLLGGSLYLLGSNVFNWEVQHNIMHHTHTNVGGIDEDIDTKGPIRLCEHAQLKKIHKFQHIYAFFFYSLMTIVKLFKEFPQLARYNKLGITKKNGINPTLEYIKMVIYKIAYLFVIVGLPILITDFLWWQVIIGFLIMHLITGAILMAHVVEGTVQPMPNENGIIETDWAVHQLNTTSDFGRDSNFLNWFVGGLNFQIEHHLFPNISHVHYRKLSPIVERTAIQFGLVYNLKPSFASALVSHVKRLKELGR